MPCRRQLFLPAALDCRTIGFEIWSESACPLPWPCLTLSLSFTISIGLCSASTLRLRPRAYRPRNFSSPQLSLIPGDAGESLSEQELGRITIHAHSSGEASDSFFTHICISPLYIQSVTIASLQSTCAACVILRHQIRLSRNKSSSPFFLPINDKHETERGAIERTASAFYRVPSRLAVRFASSPASAHSFPSSPERRTRTGYARTDGRFGEDIN